MLSNNSLTAKLTRSKTQEADCVLFSVGDAQIRRPSGASPSPKCGVVEHFPRGETDATKDPGNGSQRGLPVRCIQLLHVHPALSVARSWLGTSSIFTQHSIDIISYPFRPATRIANKLHCGTSPASQCDPAPHHSCGGKVSACSTADSRTTGHLTAEGTVCPVRRQSWVTRRRTTVYLEAGCNNKSLAVNSGPLGEQDSWVECVERLKGQGVDELERARRLRVVSVRRSTEVYRLQSQQDPLEAERLLDGDLEAEEVEQEALAAVKNVSESPLQSWARTRLKFEHNFVQHHSQGFTTRVQAMRRSRPCIDGGLVT